MKKVVFLSCVALIGLHAHSFGQSLLSRLHFGLKGGVNYSDFSNADFSKEGDVGYHGGAIVAFSLTNKWSVQEEFLFSSQSVKFKDGENPFNSLGPDKLKLSYISVPILLKYHSALGLYAEAGPQFNILAKDAKDLGSDKFAEKIDVGAAAGIGYQFKTGPVKGLGIGARYYYGFTKVSKLNLGNVSNPDFKNAVVQGSIFYIF